MSNRKPDYEVSAMFVSTEIKGKIGVAWKNENGTISVRLNPFVQLLGEEDLRITLFPVEGKEERIKQSKKLDKIPKFTGPPDLEDNIPF